MATLKTNRTGALSMKVDLNAAGNIAQTGDEVVGSKTISIPNVTTDVSLAQADKLYDEIIGKIGGGSYDTLTTEQTIKRKVVE